MFRKIKSFVKKHAHTELAIIIIAVVLALIAAGLVVLKTLLSSKKTEKVFYTANKESYES